MIEIKRYTVADKLSWNAFIASAKNATFLFDRNFMDYHNDRFEDYSLLCFNEDKLVAVLPANVVGNHVFSHQGLTYGGIVFQQDTKLFDAFEIYKAILMYLHQNNIEKLDVKVIPTFYNLLPSDELEYFMFLSDATLLKRDVLMVIDYKNKLKFKKNRREGINKAKRAGLTLKVDANYEGFWNEILVPNLNNKHQVNPVHSLEEIKLLASNFPENIKQVNVYKGEKLVAGSTVFLTKTTIHPQYVSGNSDKNKYGSLDVLYDYIINHFKTDKHYFDFNISSEKNGAIINKGLIFWKEGCGARSVVANNYQVSTEVSKSLKLELK
ncbi:MAG: GNAT family N-acetyltransferase [Flavobacteriaceae bacterium]